VNPLSVGGYPLYEYQTSRVLFGFLFIFFFFYKNQRTDCDDIRE